jgi:hypothetical protein
MKKADAELHKEFPEFRISLTNADPVKAAQDCFAAGVQF